MNEVITRDRIGITMGDPAGVGPEIIVKTLAAAHGFYDQCVPVVIGDARVLAQTIAALDVPVRINVVDTPDDALGVAGTIDLIDLNNADPAAFAPGQVSALAGHASVEYIQQATRMALAGDLAAIVTAPINKESINKGGHHYAGHTELLKDLTDAQHVSMMLVSSKLRVLHVSTHVALREACDRVKKERVLTVIRLAHLSMKLLGIEAPRVAVAGLNPHAGEGGLFGREELDEIIPAIEAAQAQGINATGPWPPDTIFMQTVKGHHDVVVAMYHDQGHIPMKLLGFDEGVNVSVGLPIIRTSVDHGTAFDIVGKGIASETSLIAAIDLAAQMVTAKATMPDLAL
ncbi:MAG: 4-hydroxythreonine-4-phosphate dehydrogenase PdxA [Anaerolineaceae bacterium]|nr:4-hydroxythreonine-4-phosphate dehydrogenase PdxA [Anaerolineaceae bacterium]